MMSNLKPPVAKSFNTPRSPSVSSFGSDNSGKDLEEREADNTLIEGAKSWINGSSVDSREASLNLLPLRAVILRKGKCLLMERWYQERRKDLEKIVISKVKKSKLSEILLPQKAIRLSGFKDELSQLEYQPNPTTRTTAKFDLQTGITEESGETVTKLSIEVDVKSEEIEKEKNLELVVRLEVYDPVKLRSHGSREKPWRYPFPQGTTHIKVLPTLAAQKEVDDSAKNLEIRVELKVECFEIV